MRYALPLIGMPTVSISLMLAVRNAAAAAEWYKRALGAEELWNFENKA